MGGTLVNKTDLIEALSGRLGDKRKATDALDAVLDTIQNAVTMGDKVVITGFGVFENRIRGPRIARNPRTGEAVKVKKTAVPTFRPGTGFKDQVAAGRVAKATKTTAAAKKAAPTKATKAATKAAPAKKSTRAATSPAARRTTSTSASARPSSQRRTTSSSSRIRTSKSR
jgi:DNA-binding protein HU-beta